MSRIQAFQTTFDKGIARPNLFHVDFPKTPFESIKGVSPGNSAPQRNEHDEMSLRVQSVNMPGKNITTSPNDNAYGPSYEMANGVSFAEEIEITFVLDQDHRTREFFNKWQDRVVNPSNYDLNYYDDYIGEMRIFQVDQNERAASAVQIHEVYPKTVGPIAYSMESGSSIVTVSVNMAFRNWTPLVVAFEATNEAVWLTDPESQPNGIIDGILDPLYEISSAAGIAIPSRIQNVMDRLQILNSAINDPTQVIKQALGQRVSSFIGGL